MLDKMSIDEASKNLSKVEQIVKDNGAIVIMINDEQYILQKYNDITAEEFADDLRVKKTSEEFIEKYLDAFKELA